MSDRNEVNLSTKDHEAALTEVSFLLSILVDTIQQVVGGSTPALGTAAGRHMGKKLPIYLQDPSLQDVLDAISTRMTAGFEMSFACDDSGADAKFGRCAIRDVCAARGLELGGDLCSMFHYYLGGMSAELLGKPVRTKDIKAGDTCTARMQA